MRFALVSAVLLASGCDTFDPRPRRPVDAGAQGSAQAPTPFQQEAKARMLLASWVAAQNANDADGLAALYAPDAAAPALEERKKLAASHLELTIGAPHFEHVQNTLVARFTERRRWPSHAEHGPRTLAFSDALRILREEPMTAVPGIEEVIASASDGTALVTPLTVTLGWTAGVLVLHVTDAKGGRVDVPLHKAAGHPDGPIAPLRAGPETVVADGAKLFATRVAGPAGTTDFFEVRHVGSYLVVGQGVQPTDILQVDAATVQLSPGAKVVAR